MSIIIGTLPHQPASTAASNTAARHPPPIEPRHPAAHPMSFEQQRDAAEACRLAANLDATGRFRAEGLTFAHLAQLPLSRLQALATRYGVVGNAGSSGTDEFAGYSINSHFDWADKSVAETFVNHRLQHEAAGADEFAGYDLNSHVDRAASR
jgi:hypothetical protein